MGTIKLLLYILSIVILVSTFVGSVVLYFGSGLPIYFIVAVVTILVAILLYGEE